MYYDWNTARARESDKEHVVLWHGCLGKHAVSIRQNGVDPSCGLPDTDFGRGFYLTTLKRQAQYWALEKYRALNLSEQSKIENHPAILKFRVKRDELADLKALHLFVRSDTLQNEDYWSLVCHCRSSTTAVVNNHRCNKHIGPTRLGWYDIVTGPVAAFWKQLVCAVGYDQISFHTTSAADVLNRIVLADRNDANFDPRSFGCEAVESGSFV